MQGSHWAGSADWGCHSFPEFDRSGSVLIAILIGKPDRVFSGKLADRFEKKNSGIDFFLKIAIRFLEKNRDPILRSVCGFGFEMAFRSRIDFFLELDDRFFWKNCCSIFVRKSRSDCKSITNPKFTSAFSTGTQLRAQFNMINNEKFPYFTQEGIWCRFSIYYSISSCFR